MILKQKLNYSWNRKHKYNVNYVISDSRLNMAKPVSTYAISVLIGGFGEFGEFGIDLRRIDIDSSLEFRRKSAKICSFCCEIRGMAVKDVVEL